MFAMLMCFYVPAWALTLTGFYEFENHVSDSPTKNILVTDPDIPTAPCANSMLDKPLALADVVELALCNSPKTAEMWATVSAQAAQVGVQRSNYLPKVNLNYGISRIQNKVTNSLSSQLDQDNRILNRGYSLRLSWLIADFGQRSAKNNQADALLDAANAMQDAVLQEVFMTAAQSYFDNQSAQATLTAYEDSEKVTAESLAAATAKFKAGVGLLTDKLQAQTAHAQARFDRTKAEGELKNAHGNLASAMGLLANTHFVLFNQGNQLESTDFVSSVDEMIQQALDSHPSIKAAKAKLKGSKENVSAVKADGLPSLSMNAESSRTDQLGQQQILYLNPSNVYTNNASVGFQLNIPLFEGFSRGYQIQSAQAESRVRVAELEKATQQVTLDVWKSYHALVSERENLRATEELVTNSMEAFKVAQGRYNAGVGNIIELLNAQNAWSNAQQQSIKSLAAWRTARLRLAASMGGLGLWAIVK